MSHSAGRCGQLLVYSSLVRYESRASLGKWRLVRRRAFRCPRPHFGRSGWVVAVLLKFATTCSASHEWTTRISHADWPAVTSWRFRDQWVTVTIPDLHAFVNNQKNQARAAFRARGLNESRTLTGSPRHDLISNSNEWLSLRLISTDLLGIERMNRVP